MKPRVVHVKKGQTVMIDAGKGCVLELTRFTSGAVTLRNVVNGYVVRAWSPKEAKSP